MVKAVARLLRPLVRMLLSYRVPYPFVAELLKGAYVDLASTEFRVAGRRLTQSRVSLLTGLHRKDVKRLMTLGKRSSATVPADVSLGVQIATIWLSDREFLDETGRPLALPRTASKGGSRSFETLVSRVSKDIHPRSVLDEWVRLGVVEIGADDLVRLKAGAFVPEKGFDEKVYFLGQNVHDHLATAVHNVAGQGPPRIERSVFYDGLSDGSVAELAELAAWAGMKALLEVNRLALELKQRDPVGAPGTQRMNFGLYFYQGPQDDQEDPHET